MKQQTAINWLYKELFPKKLDGFSEEEWDKIDTAFKEALKKEEEQIKQAYGDGLNAHRTNFCNRDEYFNQTYKP